MNSAGDEEERENKQVNRTWFLLVFAVLLLWGGMGVIANTQGANRGTFGDMFGAVNALFTGLAFAGILMTIMLQMKELRLQRLELRDTRVELKGQKEQLTSQASTLKRQAADANFFRMLEMFRHMAQNIRHPGGVPRADEDRVRNTHQNVFSLNGDEINRIVGVEYWRLLAKVCRYDMNDGDIQRIEKRWDDIYRRWDTSLATYFATLTELLMLIAEADEKQGRLWAKILRAQLGLQEMLPIFFYGLSPMGRERLKPHIENFGIFAHFSNDPEYHKIAPHHCYEASAFSPQGAWLQPSAG